MGRPGAALVLVLGGLVPGHLSGQERREDSVELRRLVDADQAARTGPSTDVPMAVGDAERRSRLFELLAEGSVVTARDKYLAALLLQHTAPVVRDGRLVSSSPENHRLAVALARASLAMGYEPAARMVALTTDRLLVFTEGRQAYGTQTLVDLETGEEYYPEIDRSVTDEERAGFGVAPLAELLERHPERPRWSR